MRYLNILENNCGRAPEPNLKMQKKQEGFTYIEVMCAMTILLIGILGQLSALSWAVLRQKESEQQNMARQIASSTLESIFAARDLGKAAGIGDWETINTSDVNGSGIFVPGWNLVRQSGGKDGIRGTSDDACGNNAVCQVDGYVNSSPVINGFERQILIYDVVDGGAKVIGKRRIEIKIRFTVGQAVRMQSIATVISDLPFYK